MFVPGDVLQDGRDANDVRPANVPDSRDVMELTYKEMNMRAGI